MDPMEIEREDSPQVMRHHQIEEATKLEQALLTIGVALSAQDEDVDKSRCILTQMTATYQSLMNLYDGMMEKSTRESEQFRQEREALDSKSEQFRQEREALDKKQDQLRADRLQFKNDTNVLAFAQEDFENRKSHFQERLDQLEGTSDRFEQLNGRIRHNDDQLNTVRQSMEIALGASGPDDLRQLVGARMKSVKEFAALETKLKATESRCADLEAELNAAKVSSAVNHTNLYEQGRPSNRPNGNKRPRIEPPHETWTSSTFGQSDQSGVETNLKSDYFGRQPSGSNPSTSVSQVQAATRIRIPILESPQCQSRSSTDELQSRVEDMTSSIHKSSGSANRFKRQPKWPSDEDKTNSLESVFNQIQFTGNVSIDRGMIQVLEQGLSLFQSQAHFRSLCMAAQNKTGPKCASARAAKDEGKLDAARKYSCDWCEHFGTLCIMVVGSTRTVLPRQKAIEMGLSPHHKAYWLSEGQATD